MMLRIFILIFLLTVIPPVYLYRIYIKPRKGGHWRWIFFVPNIMILLAAIVLTVFETYTPHNAEITNWFFTLFTGYVVSESVFALCVGLSRIFRSRAIRNVGLALGVLSAVANVYIIAVGTTYGKNHIELKQHQLPHPALPQSFDGYRIVHLSDLHLASYGGKPDFVHRLVSLVNQQQPDLIVVTGDLVSYHADELLPYLDELKQLRARDGVVSIMGNHDYMMYIKWPSPSDREACISKLQHLQHSMGWNLLLNDHLYIRRGQDSIAIVGVENDGNPPFPQRADLPRALKGIPATHEGLPFFKILLSHDPSHWRRSVLPDTDIQITLSGHTHGGQLLIGGFHPISLVNSEWAGTYREGPRMLFVSTGLGEALFTFRYGVWPEIDVLTLQKRS